MSFPSVPIVFRGLEEGLDPKSQPIGALAKADNCAMDKARRIVKRPGTDGLVRTKVGGGSVSAGLRLFQTGESGLGLIDGSSAYTYAEDAALWQTVDRVSRLRAVQWPLVDSARSAHAVDCALSGDLLIVVWMSSSDQFAGTSADQQILYEVVDVSTMATVVPPTQVVSAGRHPRVTIHGTTADLWWSNAAGELRYRELNLSTFALGASTAQKTGLVASSMFDVHVDSGLIYLAFNVSGTGLRIESLQFSHANEDGPTTVAALAGSLADVCIKCVEAEGGYVAWAIQGIGGTVQLASFNGATTVTTGPTTMASPTQVDSVFVARQSSTTLLLGWGFEGTSTNAYYGMTTELVTAATHAVTANTVRTTTDILPVSRPWQVNSQWYVAATTQAIHATNDSVADVSTVVVEISLSAYTAAVATHPHVATLENQIGAPRALTASTANWIRGWTVPTSGTMAYCPSMSAHEPWSDSETIPARRVNVNRLYNDGDLWKVVRNGAATLVAGAVPGLYDGLTVQPYGFQRPPHIASAGAAAGGSIVAGTYQYCAVLVRVGPDGLMQRSAPSNIVSATTAGGNLSVTLRVAAASLSGKVTEGTGFTSIQAPTFVEFYRTTIGGSILYRLTMEPIYNLVANDPTAAFATFTDTVADADITGAAAAGIGLATRPQLYTYTELDDVAPPACTTATVHRNRFALIASDEYTLAFSKDITEDPAIVPGFNEALTLSFSTRKKALASLDDKLIVFGEDDIDIVFGEGPNANGDGSSWQISRVQTDVGCTDPKSVCVTPMGVVFQSRRGIEILTRGLTVEPIGQSIEDTLSSYPYITSAVLVARDGHVRWTCVDSAYPATPNSGVVIVWDYINKAWFVWRYKDAANTDVSNVAFADAALVDGTYTMVTYAGQVYREDRSTYLDDGTDWVERDLQLAWISPGGPNGWHRFQSFTVNGTPVTNHDLKVSIGRDYATTWEQDNTFAAQGDVTTTGVLQKAKVYIRNQLGQAIRVRLQDQTPTTGSIGTGAGPIWEGLTLSALTKRGTTKASSGRQA